MKYILNMSIPLAIDRTNTIIDTRTRVKVSENTIIEGGQSARYQNYNKISSFSPLFVAHLYKRDASTQNGHINVTIYHAFNYYLEAYVSAMFSPHRMRIPTTLAVVFNSVRMGSFTPGDKRPMNSVAWSSYFICDDFLTEIILPNTVLLYFSIFGDYKATKHKLFRQYMSLSL